MRKLLLLGAALGALAPAGAWAAEAATDVGEVVVSGRLEETLPQTLSQYGNRLETVDLKRIQDGGYVDVGQVLASEVPGLSLVPQSGPFSYNTASLQGSRTNEILYLIDGVRISNRLYNTTPPLDTVPAHMVQRIEVLEGGQGLFYGTQAVAGVINIVTRDFTDTPHGRFEAGGNTTEGWTINGYVSAAAGRNRFIAFASHDRADGFQPFPTADYQPSGTDRERGYKMTSVGGKYAFEASDSLKVSASYTHNEGWVDFARPVQAARAVNYRNEEIAWAKVDWDASDRVSLYIKGYWHDWDSHYDEIDNTPAGPDHVDDYEFWGFHDYGLNAVGRFVAQPGLELWGGYDLQKYGGHDDVLLIERRNETAQALFGQLRVNPELLPRTHLAAGVRANFIKNGQDATVWNVSGSFDLTDSLFARASGGTSFRLPDAESLFANDPIDNGEIGNPNLKPERGQNLNASFGGRADRFNWEVVGFWRETKDLIDLSGETPDPDVFTFINLPDKVKARGFELVGTFSPADWATVTASYTHNRTRMTGSSDQLAGVPEDLAQIVVDLGASDGAYGGGATFNWLGDVVDNVSSGFGRQDRGDYANVDLNAWVRLGEYGRLSARLENALDEDYSTRINRATADTGGSYLIHYRGVPRTLHVTYAYSF